MAFLLSRGNVIYNGQIVAPRRVLAEFSPPLSTSALAQLAAALHATARPVGGAGAILFQSSDLLIPALEANLRARPGTVYVETDPVRIPAGVPDDPDFSLQWYLHNFGQCVPVADTSSGCGTAGVDIGAETAWNYNVGYVNPQPVVAILDSGLNGVDIDQWQAPSSFTLNLGAGPFTCPAGTGGLSVVTGDSGCGKDADNSTDGHGTAMAGIVGSIGGNDVGITGIGWSIPVFPIRIFQSDGVIYASDDADGIEAAVQMKQFFGSAMDIVAVNMSFQNINYNGTNGYSQTEINEINRAAQFGILAVVAAGNDCATEPDYPARFYLPNEIVVGASDQNDDVSNWGSYGCSNAGADIDAPGSNIWTTALGSGYQAMSGTSPATAVVSGSVALIDGICRMPWEQLQHLLCNTTAHPAGIPASFAAYGRLDLGNALQECATAVPSAGTITFASSGGDSPGATCPHCCFTCGHPRPAFGTVIIKMEEFTWSFSFDAGSDTPDSLATRAVQTITADGTAPVRATSPGATVTLTSVAGRPYTEYPFTVSFDDECVPTAQSGCDPNPFSASTTPMTGGH